MTVTLTSFVKSPDGTCRATFADGSALEFFGLADLQDRLRGVDNEQNTKLVCLAYAMARSADLSNVTSVLNKQFTFDLTLNQPVKVQ